MKKSIVSSLLWLLCVTLSAAAQPALKGRFIEVATGNPISDVEVQIYVGCVPSVINPIPGSKIVTTLSAADGQFFLKGEAPTSGCTSAPLQATYSIKKTGYNFQAQGSLLPYQTLTLDFKDIRGTNLPKMVALNAASYVGAGDIDNPDFRRLGLPQTITAIFGSNLATNTLAAGATPLPTTLANRRVTISDGTGVERPTPLLYVSPTQINCIIPTGLTSGWQIVRLYDETRPIAISFAIIDVPISGYFSLNGTGRDVAAGFITRVKLGNLQSVEPIARYDDNLKKFVPVPIDFGTETDRIFLTIFGTGFRSIPQASFFATIGGSSATVTYAGPQPSFAGLDQINLEIPRSLKGRGDALVRIDYGFEGNLYSPNILTVNFR